MKPIFSVILTGLIVLIAFQVYALVNPDSNTLQPQQALKQSKADLPQPKSKTNSAKPVQLKKAIAKVSRRNLFKVQVNGKINAPPPPPENQHLEKTSLKLNLWGTVTGNTGQDSWAVIGDPKKKEQDLYRVNDKIQGATIKSILRNKIILTVNGKDQVLEINEDPSPATARMRRSLSKKPRRGKDNNPAMPEPPEIPDMASRPNPLFKTRPYIKNGEASGVMVYSIKKNSVAKRLGLRNGDIIQAVDDEEIGSPDDLENFDDGIDSSSEITISILRRGKPKELVFSGQDNAYTINDIEQ